MPTFTEDQVPDLQGKICLVTGGNAGLGFDNCRALFAKNATVLLAGRNQTRVSEAVDKIKASSPSSKGQILPVLLDLANLEQVKRVAADISSQHPRLDVLILNAGVMALPSDDKTAQGFDMQMGVNHIAHFLLTASLFGMLLKSEAPRVVAVSSLYHKKDSAFDFEAFPCPKVYNTWTSYYQSKLANVLFYKELHRRCRDAGNHVHVFGAHPGYSSTGLQQKVGGVAGFMFHYIANVLFAQSSQQGALPQLFAATSPDAEAGAYYGPKYSIRGPVSQDNVSAAGEDPNSAKQLWEATEKVTGVTFAVTK